MTNATNSQDGVRPLRPNEITAIVVTYRRANGWRIEPACGERRHVPNQPVPESPENPKGAGILIASQ